MGLGGRAVPGVWRRPGRHRRRLGGRGLWVEVSVWGCSQEAGGSWLGFPRGSVQGRSQDRVARSEGQSGCNSPWPAAVVGQGLEPHTVVWLPPPDPASPPLTADTGLLWPEGPQGTEAGASPAPPHPIPWPRASVWGRQTGSPQVCPTSSQLSPSGRPGAARCHRARQTWPG